MVLWWYETMPYIKWLNKVLDNFFIQNNKVPLIELTTMHKNNKNNRSSSKNKTMSVLVK